MATLTQSGACLIKAGDGVSDIFKTAGIRGQTSDELWIELIDQAEGIINSRTRKDWVGMYSSMDAEDKKILDSAASAHAAMSAVAYDLSGYVGQEGAIKLDVLKEEFLTGLQILKESKTWEFLGAT